MYVASSCNDEFCWYDPFFLVAFYSEHQSLSVSRKRHIALLLSAKEANLYSCRPGRIAPDNSFHCFLTGHFGLYPLHVFHHQVCAANADDLFTLTPLLVAAPTSLSTKRPAQQWANLRHAMHF